MKDTTNEYLESFKSQRKIDLSFIPIDATRCRFPNAHLDSIESKCKIDLTSIHNYKNQYQDHLQTLDNDQVNKTKELP